MQKSIALGFFDGVHLAHRKIIRAACLYAKEHGLEPLALTFDRSPAEALFGAAPILLTDNREKERLIKSFGAVFVALETTPALLGMRGADFVDRILVSRFNAGALFCGYNYTFGSDRLTARDLEQIGRDKGIVVKVLPEESRGGLSVSSSRIRSLLDEGNAEDAATLLGRPYSVTGTVARGKGLGHTRGFPTLNIYPPFPLPLPRGVYAARVIFGGEAHASVVNIGVNPTVGDGSFRIEAHILDFSGDLYGLEVRIEFLHFIRPERKFADLDDLYAQIAIDKETVRRLI